MSHTLTARVNDLMLELKLWILSWIATSALFASIAYILRAMTRRDAADAWRDYVLARLLDGVGLGSVPISPLETAAGIIWEPPVRILATWREHFLPAILSMWDNDLLMILSSPLYALMVLAGVALILSEKRI